MIKLPGQWPVRWLCAGLFLVCWSGAARSEERIDPSDPTAVHANVSFLPEFRAMPGGGSVSGTRIDLNQGFLDGRVLTDVELPLLAAHVPGQGTSAGLGDVRLKAFYLPYVSDSGTIQAFALNLDATAPTGSASRGLGAGTWVFMPAVVAKVALGGNVNWYPFLRGLVSTRSARLVRQFQSENPVVYDQIEQGWWLVANPIFTHDFAPQPGARDYRVDLKLSGGQMFTDTFGVGLEGMKYLAGQVDARYQVKLTAFYYF